MDKPLIILKNSYTDEDLESLRKEWESFEPRGISIVSLETEVKLLNVKILKEKKGVPTLIEWQGKKYVLHHSDQFKR